MIFVEGGDTGNSGFVPAHHFVVQRYFCIECDFVEQDACFVTGVDGFFEKPCGQRICCSVDAFAAIIELHEMRTSFTKAEELVRRCLPTGDGREHIGHHLQAHGTGRRNGKNTKRERISG